MYASTNLDELGAENIAHYLEFNDPNRMSRTVGQWMDEQLLGRAAADRVTFNFASNVDFDPAKREIIETVFENELPSTATDKFKAMALKVANSVDATLDRKSLERELIEKNFPRSSPGPMGIFFDSGKKLEHLVQSYWGEDFEAVTKIRAAWQELHGLETSVNYKEADLIAAMEIDRVWKIRTVESTRPMYRGINYFIDDEETLRHVEELTRVGHEFDLPISSFTHEQWVAQGFIDVLADKENTKAIWIEVQKGARAMPLQNEEPIDLDLKPPWIELISSGRFKVVKVDEQWKPTRKQLEEMAYSTIHRDSTPEELQEEIDSLLEQFEGRVSRVLLRRVGD